jgi:DNA-binding NarL/FixJ family response regulator
MISERNFPCNFRTLAILENAENIINKIRNLKPDFLFIDSELPHFNGFELAENLKKLNLSTKIIIYASKKNPDYLTKFLNDSNHTIRGFIHRGCGIQELEFCLIEVFAGNKYLSSNVNNYLNHLEEVPEDEKQVAKKLSFLSEKEKEILYYLSEGNSESKIAEKLFISVNTVRTHKTRISEKFGITGKQKLTYFAVQFKGKLR